MKSAKWMKRGAGEQVDFFLPVIIITSQFLVSKNQNICHKKLENRTNLDKNKG
jgi:hypothetical protein